MVALYEYAEARKKAEDDNTCKNMADCMVDNAMGHVAFLDDYLDGIKEQLTGTLANGI